jgi:putative ATP-binding cassette transporter
MKNILKEFFALTGIPHRTVILLAVVGILTGAANAGVMAIIGGTLGQESSLQPAVAGGLFVVVALFYFVLQRYTVIQTAYLTQDASAYIRTQVLDAELKAPLEASERFDHHYKQLILSRDATQVGAALPAIVGLLGSMTTVLCALVYLFWVSLLAGVVVCLVVALAIAVYQTLIWRTTDPLRAAYAENDRAFGFIDDLLLGHKELKLDAIWSREFINDDLMPSVENSAQQLGKVQATQQSISLISFIAILALLGGATFLPPLLGMSSAVVVSTVVVLLFMQIYVISIVVTFPRLVEMWQSARRIHQLMDDLRDDENSDAAPDKALSENESLPADWQQLHLSNIGYSYKSLDNPSEFVLHGIDLTVERGQIVFIVGGNGSGKTTLAKVLLGLYPPSFGEILLDDVPVNNRNRHQYRQMFNAVFTSVHLFRRRLEGALADPESPVRKTLDDMSIRLTVSDDQRLDVRPFSQGQKKRLASALALMNDKPMCLFDEWTADQDPEFRRYFHTHYLPALQAAGKTLFVISHDDHYFHHADLIVRMEDGRIVSAAPPVERLHANGQGAAGGNCAVSDLQQEPLLQAVTNRV